jgi:hypothetical protein
MRYFLGFLAVIGVLVLIFVLILRGGGKDSVETQLTDYTATQTVMRLTIDGPVNADQDHRVIRVTVGRNLTTIDIIQGYEGHTLDSRSYANNEDSYGTFLRALQLAGYTDGNDDPELTDSRGVCSTGRVYTMEIITGSDTVQKFWRTSCDSGTFGGETNLIRKLFRLQIPDYNLLTRSVGLN